MQSRTRLNHLRRLSDELSGCLKALRPFQGPSKLFSPKVLMESEINLLDKITRDIGSLRDAAELHLKEGT